MTEIRYSNEPVIAKLGDPDIEYLAERIRILNEIRGNRYVIDVTAENPVKNAEEIVLLNKVRRT